MTTDESTIREGYWEKLSKQSFDRIISQKKLIDSQKIIIEGMKNELENNRYLIKLLKSRVEKNGHC